MSITILIVAVAIMLIGLHFIPRLSKNLRLPAWVALYIMCI